LRETLPVRFWIEIIVGSVTLALFLLTLVWPDWIEIGLGWDPDNHNGAVEWSIAGLLLVAATAVLGAARSEWRRTRTAPAQLSSNPAD
jgi:hypothetical protein